MEKTEKCPTCGQVVPIIVKKMTPIQILTFLSCKEGVTIEELKSPDRHKRINDVRQLYFYIAKKYNPKFTFREIGIPVNRHYATVMHGVKLVAKYKSILEVRDSINQYLNELRSVPSSQIPSFQSSLTDRK